MLCFQVVVDDNTLRLQGYAQSVQTNQQVVPSLFRVWAILDVEELDFFHCTIIVEKTAFSENGIKKSPRIMIRGD